MTLENYKSFKSLVYNAKTIKTYYLGLLSSFSMYEIRKKRETIYNFKKDLYKLGKYMDEWKVDKIWEYLNDDISYIDLFMLRNL